jgi:hypothetical protein
MKIFISQSWTQNWTTLSEEQQQQQQQQPTL